MTPQQIAERAAWQNGLETIDLTQQEVDALLEYSTTLPTGKTIGKRWKRYLAAGPKAGSWVLCEYVEDPDPDYVGIRSLAIRIVTPEETQPGDRNDHHPNCYQSTGNIPADLPADLCDCRVLRMIDAHKETQQ